MQDSEGLHAIARPGGTSPAADIVFVHGLGGGSHSTWRNTKSGFFWPEELGKELPQCGVWTIGYPAGITKFGNPGMIIGDRGLNVADQLRLAGIGTDRPILFITHSMGGLVVKAIIDGCHLHVDPRMEALVRRIKGIAFCGTPHHGSPFARAASVLNDYFRWAAQAHVQEMATNAAGLELLHYRFMGWLRSHPLAIHCFAEKEPLFTRSSLFARSLSLGPVVPSTSAVIPGQLHTPVDADHLSLVKPSSRRSHIYQGMLDFILTTLPDVRPVP